MDKVVQIPPPRQHSTVSRPRKSRQWTLDSRHIQMTSDKGTHFKWRGFNRIFSLPWTSTFTRGPSGVGLRKKMSANQNNLDFYFCICEQFWLHIPSEPKVNKRTSSDTIILNQFLQINQILQMQQIQVKEEQVPWLASIVIQHQALQAFPPGVRNWRRLACRRIHKDMCWAACGYCQLVHLVQHRIVLVMPLYQVTWDGLSGVD